MAVNIDDPRGDEFAAAVDNIIARRNRGIAAADRLDLAAREQHDAIVDPPAFAVKDRDAAQAVGRPA